MSNKKDGRRKYESGQRLKMKKYSLSLWGNYSKPRLPHNVAVLEFLKSTDSADLFLGVDAFRPEEDVRDRTVSQLRRIDGDK